MSNGTTADDGSFSEPLSRFERTLTLLTQIRAGEGRGIVLFFLQAFLLLTSYYIIRALREGFILVDFGAAQRAYAVGVSAALLMIVVPVYSRLRRRMGSLRLTRAITWFFVGNLILFYLFWQAGFAIGFVFFVWVGLFGLMVVSQFWAFAAGTFNRRSGQRLFPVVMIGANLGALAGAEIAEIAVRIHGLHGVMLVGTVALALTTFLSEPARHAVPSGSRSEEAPINPSGTPRERPSSRLGGFGVVFGDRYLLLLAVVVVLLNWVNTTGEFLLAELVQEQALGLLPGPGNHDARQEFVVRFYADYMLWFTSIGLLIQVFLVSRIFRRIGIGGAVLVLPVVAAIGYGFIVFLPIFSIVRAVKIMENSVDYSLMSTTRHALFLPTNEAAKYDGKTTIDTFFWRFGDLIQAAVVFIGTGFLGWHVREFGMLALGLAAVWLVASIALRREYLKLAPPAGESARPRLGPPIPDLLYGRGGSFEHEVPGDAFVESEPGDVLTLSGRGHRGAPLPPWLSFDRWRMRFVGRPPQDVPESLVLEVGATNMDGLAAVQRFTASPYELPGDGSGSDLEPGVAIDPDACADRPETPDSGDG